MTHNPIDDPHSATVTASCTSRKPMSRAKHYDSVRYVETNYQEEQSGGYHLCFKINNSTGKLRRVDVVEEGPAGGRLFSFPLKESMRQTLRVPVKAFAISTSEEQCPSHCHESVHPPAVTKVVPSTRNISALSCTSLVPSCRNSEATYAIAESPSGRPLHKRGPTIKRDLTERTRALSPSRRLVNAYNRREPSETTKKARARGKKRATTTASSGKGKSAVGRSRLVVAAKQVHPNTHTQSQRPSALNRIPPSMRSDQRSRSATTLPPATLVPIRVIRRNAPVAISRRRTNATAASQKQAREQRSPMQLLVHQHKAEERTSRRAASSGSSCLTSSPIFASKHRHHPPSNSRRVQTMHMPWRDPRCTCLSDAVRPREMRRSSVAPAHSRSERSEIRAFRLNPSAVSIGSETSL